MIIGESIKNLRTIKGWSQEVLATKSGLHRNSIYKIEKSVTMPRMPQLKAIANALEISIDELFSPDIIDHADMVAQYAFPNDEQKAHEIREDILSNELEEEYIRVINEAEQNSDELFLKNTSIISDKLLCEMLLDEFRFLTRKGKFEAIRRLGEMNGNSRYHKESSY